MPLSGTGNALGDSLWAAVKSSTGLSPSPADDIKGRDIWRAEAAVIVSHIVANALVTVTVATTGTAAAQSGGGTGSIS